MLRLQDIEGRVLREGEKKVYVRAHSRAHTQSTLKILHIPRKVRKVVSKNVFQGLLEIHNLC